MINEKIWAMAPDHVKAHLWAVARLDKMPVPEARDPTFDSDEIDGYLRNRSRWEQYDVVDGVAVVDIVGVVLQRVPLIYRLFGIEATSLQETQAIVEEATAREDVEAIALRIDSPGGTVAGTQELAAAIAAARDAGKRVTAYVTGYAASAAYWLAMQADEIVATPLSEIGSIGVYQAVYDLTEYAKGMGIKVIVKGSGGIKGDWEPGTEPSEAYLEDVQRMVDDINGEFVAAVAAARDMEVDAVKELNTGQTWLAAEAQALGLIDRVSAIPSEMIAQKEAIGSRQDGPTDDKETAAQAAAEAQKKGSDMDKEEMRQLLATHPQHAEMIARMDGEGASKADVEAAINAEAVRLKDEELATLRATVEERDAKIAEMDAQLAEANAKIAKVEEWSATGAGNPDAGSDSRAANDGDATDDDALREEWDGMNKAQRSEWMDDFETFAYARRNPEACGIRFER